METVKIKRGELLAILKTNRETHRAIFLEALEGYRKMAIEELGVMLSDAKAGRKIRRAVSLIEPMDQTKDYDRAIRMMELEVREEVELTPAEFAQYVMDDWRWKDQFIHSNITYSPSLQG
jgi:hypothetical protein